MYSKPGFSARPPFMNTVYTCMCDRLELRIPTRMLRSSDNYVLNVPRYNLKSYGGVSLLCLHCRCEKTLVHSGHVALVDQHFPSRVVFSLYFDPATWRKSVRLARHFLY